MASKSGLSNRFWLYITLFFIGIFMIFFVWKVSNEETHTRSFQIINDWYEHFREWLDVSGGTRLTYKISYDKYEQLYNWKQLMDAKQQVEDIIIKNNDSRISELWVSDYKAYVQVLDETRYLVVEIWGISDLDEAKWIIGKTVELEFKFPNTTAPSADDIANRKQLANNLFQEAQKWELTSDQLFNNRQSEGIFYFNYNSVWIEELPLLFKNNNELLTQAIQWEWFADVISWTFDEAVWTDSEGNPSTEKFDGFSFFRVNNSTWDTNTGTLYSMEAVFVNNTLDWEQAVSSKGDILNGAYFELATPWNDQLWSSIVSIQFNDKWKDVFCDISTENIWNNMAIFIWGHMVTNATIQDRICGGAAQISWNYTPESAKELADELNSWALPAPLILTQEEKISPSLGSNALQWALVAAAIGIIAIFVLVFILYWTRKALVTIWVLLAFLSALWLFMKLVDFALSLSGIAAVILSIWMAVDANILIFERMREELKEWKSTNTAIDNGYNRSWSAIRDGNVSTWIIALLLMIFGSSIFKWFGTMLFVTVLITLFINVPLTKELLKLTYKGKK